MRLVPPLLVCLAVLSGSSGTAFAADAPPPQPVLDVGTALAPGNSGFVSVAGQAQGLATGDPGAYGEHVDDQREMFWDGAYKDGRFAPPTGTPQEPKPGVRVYEGDKGVPVIYGDTAYDTWYGAGWAAGQQRLFLADAVRRSARGTLAVWQSPVHGPRGLLRTNARPYSAGMMQSSGCENSRFSPGVRGGRSSGGAG